MGRNRQGHLALGLHLSGENWDPMRNRLPEAHCESGAKATLDGWKEQSPRSAFNLPHPSGFPPKRAHLAKLLSNTGLIKPQHTLEDRRPPLTSAGSSQQGCPGLPLLLTEGTRSMQPCHQETGNGEGGPAHSEVQPLVQSPVFHGYHQMGSLCRFPTLLPGSPVHTEEALWKSR